MIVDDCIFCKIIDGKIPCTKVYEDDLILCFNDINPEAPKHVIIIPKKHINNANELKEDDKLLIGHIFLKAKEICKELGIDESGYRIVNNCGVSGGQTVQHIHFHLLGGRSLTWPPG
jgi:histidine triad (HIT) family protein